MSLFFVGLCNAIFRRKEIAKKYKVLESLESGAILMLLYAKLKEGNEMKRFSDLIVQNRQAMQEDIIKGRFKIAKSDDEKMLAFGWASVSMRVDGELVEDWQEDIVEPEDLERAAYEFVMLYREGGEMHERGDAAVLVESVVFTEEKIKAMGIPDGVLPIGWWIGFKVTDKDVWEKVKDGTYQMFSIEGEAQRVEVPL